MQNRKLIELKDLNVHYTHENMERTCALCAVDLTIYQHEHVAIIGKNGSGKSTLLRILRGEMYPDQVNGGSIFWYENFASQYYTAITTKNSDFTHPNKSEKKKHIPECTFNILAPKTPSTTVPDNSPLAGRSMTSLVSPKTQEYYATQAWNVNCQEIILAAKTDDYILYKTPSKKEKEEAAQIASMLGAEHLLHSKISVLSQGQLRIMLIARALIRNAPVLLLDEATNGLDVQSQDLVIQTLTNLVEDKKNNLQTPTIVLTSHRLPLPSFIKKAYSMNHGVLSPLKIDTITNPTRPSLAQIDNIQNQQLAHCRSNQAEIHDTSLEKLLTQSSKIKIHNTVNTDHSLPHTQQALHISLKNASAYIDHTEILHHINWEITQGQQWAVQGENGSGKSTLLKVLLGFIPVALGGSITRTFYDTSNPKGILLTELATIKQHIRLVSDALQTYYTYNDTVEDIVFCGLDGNIGVYRHPNEEEVCVVEKCIQDLNLTSLRKRKLHSLSTGQARRCLLARAIIGSPSLLLLDEPFSGLDISSRTELMDCIEMQIHKGVQTILVSHHQEDFLKSTTHLARMEKGILK